MLNSVFHLIKAPSDRPLNMEVKSVLLAHGKLVSQWNMNYSKLIGIYIFALQIFIFNNFKQCIRAYYFLIMMC